jgi:hypothetical protein
LRCNPPEAAGEPRGGCVTRGACLRGVNAQVSFTRDFAGVVTGLVIHQGGRDQPARRIR